MKHNDLRKIIRNLLIEAKGEMRNVYQPGKRNVSPQNAMTAVELKKIFHSRANQASLKKLTYVHWASPGEIRKLLLKFIEKNNSAFKDEISTSIHNPKLEKMVPAQLITGLVIGIEVDGYITFASNIDLNSGVHTEIEDHNSRKIKDINSYPPYQRDEFSERMKGFGQSGVPRRPDTQSIRGGAGAIKGKKKVLILKAKDLRLNKDLAGEYENMTNQWPEALIDNWKPISLVADWNSVPDQMISWFKRIGWKLKDLKGNFI